VIKATCSLLLTAGTLGLGVYTTFESASNRERGDRLDKAQRWCEAQSRRNELLRARNARLEWLLISGEEGAWPDETVEGGDS